MVFHFKKFSLHHGNCIHKIGTDSMVLGTLVEVDKTPAKILDIGAGSGVLAFMMAQKFPRAEVYAIEPDVPSFSDLLLNVQSNEYSISPLNQLLQDFKVTSTFDLVISNPPYFQTGYYNPDDRKSSARHSGKSLSLEELFSFAEDHLSAGGTFWMIGPSDIDLPQTSLYEITNCVLFNDNEQPVRTIYAFSNQPVTLKKSSLMIRNNGKYTDQYKKLTQDFHGVRLD